VDVRAEREVAFREQVVRDYEVNWMMSNPSEENVVAVSKPKNFVVLICRTRGLFWFFRNFYLFFVQIEFFYIFSLIFEK
jgi:hypothetical protein